MTFIESMKSTLSRYSFNKKFVFNLDETPSDVKKSKSYKALLSKFLPKNNQCTPGMDYLRTILPVVSANGTIWAVFFIYKRSKDSDSNYIRRIPPPPCDHFQRGKYPLFFTSTTSGYVDTQLWFNISTKLCELIFPHLYGSECLLFLDNFSPHLSIESLKLLYEHNIHCMFLPPNTTHWIQPLDNNPNACLKNCIKSIKRKRYNCSNLTQSNKYHLLTNISIEAIDKSFKKDVIIKSFTETGVWPFDEDKIIKRSLENLGIK